MNCESQSTEISKRRREKLLLHQTLTKQHKIQLRQLIGHFLCVASALDETSVQHTLFAPLSIGLSSRIALWVDSLEAVAQHSFKRTITVASMELILSILLHKHHFFL
ncbi:hypothetical protein CDAR_97891 [Caerostris darwini]|uniref:Uncharacterized protein n=1 Tax=Caerostris darwini TaxID=1538125 RepID=A0AAV4MD70_9ARAC|nr:hypothetical protein CDAR_97891 [Caerostris darwini]